jgi:hypothetical protein
MEADFGGSFEYGGSFRGLFSIWSRMSEAIDSDSDSDRDNDSDSGIDNDNDIDSGSHLFVL